MVGRILSDYEIGFLEAALDFEGCLGLYKTTSGYYYSVVTISNKNKAVLEKTWDICGREGCIPAFRHGERLYYRYDIPKKALMWILPQIKLIVKEKQRQLIMESFEYRNRPGCRGGYTAEQRHDLERIYLELKELNRRGKP